MTALSEYQRLECTGLWRDAPDAQRREVIVSFGDATLVISETLSARALTHWSLPAVTRLNPGRRPALYSPGPDAGEALEIEDEAMIAALSKTHALIEARRPHPGRLRGAIFVGLVACIAALGLFWLPGALYSHTAGALPASKREEVGKTALTDLVHVTGSPCRTPEGSEVLAALNARLRPQGGEIVILPDGPARSAHLPGGLLVMTQALLDEAETPETVAGMILAEDQRAQDDDSFPAVLRHAGLRATLSLMTTGNLPNGSLDGYGEHLMTLPQPEPDQTGLLDGFARAGVPSTPYAYAVDPTGESTLRLIEADPMRALPAPMPIMSDTEWVALQNICAG